MYASKNKARNKRIPPIFGTRSRTEVLVLLAVRGPTPARKIASLWRVNPRTAFDWINHLRRSGVVEKRALGAAYPGLNMRYRLHANVRQLLIALSATFRPPKVEVPKWRAGFSTSAMDKPDRLGPEVKYLFGSENRTRVLVLVAVAGALDIVTIAKSLGLQVKSAEYAVNALIEDGLLAGTPDGQHKMISLDPQMPAADELRRLLRCVAKWRPVFRGKRGAARTELGYRHDRNPATSADAKGARLASARGFAAR
jgi:hypothetical protein